ncbi:MAG: hypothetical protein RBT80_17705 [Candidatus Vecturithrix sp.]|nr:hypothetical protein [Candidatus Vecturithrix sp.]
MYKNPFLTDIYGLNTELLSLKLAARIEKIETSIRVLEDSGTRDYDLGGLGHFTAYRFPPAI